MPIADDPDPRPDGRPEPDGDPFDGLVLDESFVRGAAVQEPSARTRMLTARWRVEPPVDPGGRRWSPTDVRPAADLGRRRRARPWQVVLAAVVVAVTALTVLAGPQLGLINGLAGLRDRAAQASPRPTADVPLPGGGVSDGSHCGQKDFHHFPLPSTAAPVPVGYAEQDEAAAGPELQLGSYGFMSLGGDDPGHYTFALLLGAGSHHLLELSAPLGPEGVAVEIEGPDGLVGGAHHLPVTVSDTTPRGRGGTVRVGPDNGGSATVTLPVEALCPGFDGHAVQQRLVPPADPNGTVTGQPPYTLTVSISDPAVGDLRRLTGAPEHGNILAADNRLPGH
ncbi:hypothetical protein ACGFX4_13535 [Kitasatospora sp. NPDC048365]|uniref:SCO2583/SCO2584 N-terminal domain-containing protein n=1 Tax=Kitasatospora sp. NPDC048365 TaxID=3364050 RepID=UPI003719B1F8